MGSHHRPSGPTEIIRRIDVGRAAIGATWPKRSNEGRDYLSLKLDDPSFNAPVFANRLADKAGETITLGRRATER